MEYDIDFVDTYMPKVGELPTRKLQEVRARLAARERLLRPDLDTRPNSVYGDLFLDPAAETIAAIEVGLSRFMSDLDPQNPAAGIVFNCEFVEAFLSNFSVDPLEIPVASGYVRLTFTESREYEMQRSTRFQFNNTTVFRLDLPLRGGLFILPPGQTAPVGVNTARLVETEPGVYETVVRVVSEASGSVDDGSSGTINIEDYPNLDAITAVGDFRSGEDAVSLKKRAQNVRLAAHSATPVSRGGAAMMLATKYPDTTLRSAVFSGDHELTRNLNSFLGAGPNLMDLHVRRPELITRTDVFRVPYFEDQDSVSVQRFLGVVDFLAPPSRILSVNESGEDADILASGAVRFISRSKDPSRAPLGSCGFSMLEELWMDCEVTYTGGSPSRNILVDQAGNQYGLFEITYQYDPSIEAVHKLLGSSEDMPWMDILVRGGVPVFIEEFRIKYTKSDGVTFSTAQARDEIEAYVNSIAYPGKLEEGPILESMYYAGAEDTLSITTQSRVRYTPAGKILPDGVALPDEDYAAAAAALVDPPFHNITSYGDLKFSYRDPFLGQSGETHTAGGPRNIHYVLSGNSIIFDEQ
jgi:hypothetical protein